MNNGDNKTTLENSKNASLANGNYAIPTKLNRLKKNADPRVAAISGALSGALSAMPVSYTHLDVYKRQGYGVWGHHRLFSGNGTRQYFCSTA